MHFCSYLVGGAEDGVVSEALLRTTFEAVGV